MLECSELVTKCPSKYENADSALTVEQLLGYGESVYGKVVKVAGSVGAGSLKAAARATASFWWTPRRAIRCQSCSRAPCPTRWPRALRWCSPARSGDDGKFAATDVALEG